MRHLRLAGIVLLGIASAACPEILGGGDNEDWKIVRNRSTHSCLAAISTALDPSRPELMGTYKGKSKAEAALSGFKNQDDGSGRKVCE